LPEAGDDGHQGGEVDAGFFAGAQRLRQAESRQEGARGLGVGIAYFVGDEEDDDGEEVKQ